MYYSVFFVFISTLKLLAGDGEYMVQQKLQRLTRCSWRHWFLEVNAVVLSCMYCRVCRRKPQFANLVTHPGFTEQLCYGDVSLRFLYTWSEMSKHDRERILRQNHGLQSPTVTLDQKPPQMTTQ